MYNAELYSFWVQSEKQNGRQAAICSILYFDDNSKTVAPICTKLAQLVDKLEAQEKYKISAQSDGNCGSSPLPPFWYALVYTNTKNTQMFVSIARL